VLQKEKSSSVLQKAEDDSSIFVILQNNICSGRGFQQNRAFMVPWSLIHGSPVEEALVKDRFVSVSYDCSGGISHAKDVAIFEWMQKVMDSPDVYSPYDNEVDNTELEEYAITCNKAWDETKRMPNRVLTVRGFV